MLYEIFLALIVVGSLVIVISENRKPYISLFWILFITLLPGVGLLFYLLLGKDYRSRRVIKADELALLDTLSHWQQHREPYTHRKISETCRHDERGQRHTLDIGQRNTHLYRFHPHVPVNAGRHRSCQNIHTHTILYH